ncbi:hypothetical protein C8E87_5667 [Paractinoplanes brasiliensis]|uniref:Uncharacterized protein n=1 Tax=Paractinoplanes brasiliensis TaxID=52695 RepID=A0A4R6JZP2_9ACTN|nr:hypothetical protein C8E87_5667 [Actinoplanes brasiliensis]
MMGPPARVAPANPTTRPAVDTMPSSTPSTPAAQSPSGPPGTAVGLKLPVQEAFAPESPMR